MILDKLMEKKDINAYIEMRIKYLCETYANTIKTANPRHRYSIHSKWKGRIAELKKLKQVINSNNLKQQSKKYWESAVKEMK